MFKIYALVVPLLPAYGALLFAQLGDNVTFPCFSDGKYLSWYRQVLGGEPEMISSFYIYSPSTKTFHKNFKDNNRLSIHSGENFYHLNISNVQYADSAAYFCAKTSFPAFTKFQDGIVLVVKESSSSSPWQPRSVSVSLGDSVTLNCTVHPGASAGDQRVYWFRKNPGDDQLEVMYGHTHDGGQCVTGFDSRAQSCIYSLSKRNVTLSDAGTYYCAVATCGEIVLGRGTRLDVGGHQQMSFPVWVCCLAAALLVSVTFNILATCILCKKSKQTHLQSAEEPQPSVPEQTPDSQQSEECGDLQYVAVNFKKRERQSTRHMHNHVFYSTLTRPDLH